MNAINPDILREATRLTREGKLLEATALLQGRSPGAPPRGAPPHSEAPQSETLRSAPGRARSTRLFDVDPQTGEAVPPGAGPHPTVPESAAMPGALRDMLARLQRGGPAPAQAAAPLPDRARFLAGSFANAAGSRGYRLYVPASHHGGPRPLVVMLHGCTQSPDDFAAGTRMNERAEEQGCLVVYPGQTQAANAQKCWNWFTPGDQRRDGGEPSLIAGITRQVMRDHGVDPARVYVAGLSAGGAAAAIMAQAYPDLYAAAGVHSGLACGAARDMPSAFAAMRQGAPAMAPPRAGQRILPTIVFHADQDATVHPRNGDQVMAQSMAHPGGGAGLSVSVKRGQVPNGHAYTRTLHADATGRSMLEQWVVHGGGHAWSGGSSAGSYTDARGPDASREMLRFFLQHAQGGAGQ